MYGTHDDNCDVIQYAVLFWVYVGIRKNITSSFLSQTSNNLDTSILKKITICYLLVVVLQKLIISQLLTFLLYLNTPLLIYWLGKQWRSREYCRPGPSIYGRGYWYSRNTFASVIATNSPSPPLCSATVGKYNPYPKQM